MTFIFSVIFIVLVSILLDVLFKCIFKNVRYLNPSVSFFCFLSVYGLIILLVGLDKSFYVISVLLCILSIIFFIAILKDKYNLYVILKNNLQGYILNICLTTLIFLFYEMAVSYVGISTQSISVNSINLFIKDFVGNYSNRSDRAILYQFFATILSFFNKSEYSADIVITFIRVSSFTYIFLLNSIFFTLIKKFNKHNIALITLILGYFIYIASYTIIKYNYVDILWLPLIVSTLMLDDNPLQSIFNALIIINILFLSLPYQIILLIIVMICLLITLKQGFTNNLLFSVFLGAFTIQNIYLLNAHLFEINLFIIMMTALLLILIIGKNSKLFKCFTGLIILASFCQFFLILSQSGLTLNRIVNTTIDSWGLFNSIDIGYIYIVLLILILIINGWDIYISKNKGKFNTYLLMIFVFFNPLFLDFFIKNSANIILPVFLFFSPFVVNLLFDVSIFNTYIDGSKIFMIGFLCIAWILSGYLVSNPYFETNRVKNDDYFHRVNKYEINIYDYFLNILQVDEYPIIISQLPLTNAYIPYGLVTVGFNDLTNHCQYCDVFKDNIHQPNELVNIFAYREYADNQLFIEKPDYENIKEILNKYSIDYIFIDNKHMINLNGEYLSLANHLINNDYKLLYENEMFSLFNTKKEALYS